MYFYTLSLGGGGRYLTSQNVVNFTRPLAHPKSRDFSNQLSNDNVPPLRVYRAFLHHASSKWVGLLDTGGAREGWEVLALDDKLLVALESQPRAKGATGTKKFAVDKYRLLVRT